MILYSLRYWSNIIHAATDPNTPSREKIIAAGAGIYFVKLEFEA